LSEMKTLGEIFINENNREIRGLTYRANVVIVNGLRVYMINNSSSKLTSDLGHKLSEIKDENGEYLCDYAMIWSYDAKQHEYRISLRSRRADNQGVDVGQVAKSFDKNGGGHYSAAGFSSKNLGLTLGVIF